MYNNKKNTRQVLDFINVSMDNPQVPNENDKNNCCKRIAKWHILYYSLFSIIAFISLFKHADYLYTVQERSLFVTDSSFWTERMAFLGGFSQWLGCLLTQFFYYPWLGSVMLIILWWAIAWLLKLTFRLNSIQSALTIVISSALCLSELDLGYWLYTLKLPGYWFTQTIAVLFMTLQLWGCSRLQGWWKIGCIIIATVVTYPLIGCWALIAALWSGIETFVFQDNKRQKIYTGLASLCSITFIPIIYYTLGAVRQRFEDLWTVNFPIFRDFTCTSLQPSIPFIIIALWPGILLWAEYVGEKMKQKPLNQTKSNLHAFVSGFFVIGITTLLLWLPYDNYNYEAEMRMYKAIDKNDYNSVLEEAASAPGPMTRQMVISKNIALIHTGRIGDYMFKYDNSGQPPYTYDSLNVHMVHTAGSQIYYQHGKANFACRWAIENGVEYGFNVNDLKMLARCAMISGEKQVAMKYLQILNNTFFHRSWAQERMDELNHPDIYRQTAEYKNIMPLRCFKNTLDGDDGLVEMYLINYFSHMNLKQPKFQETALMYSLIQKDIALFWPKFFTYANLHEKEQMPIHYQEAAYLYGHLENSIDINRMPFDQDRIVKRYAEFQNMSQSMLAQGMTAEQVGEACKPMFGDTFWWFYFFCRGIKSY